MKKIIVKLVCIEDKKIEDGVFTNKKIRVTIEVETDFETTKMLLTTQMEQINRFKMHSVEIRSTE